MPVIPLASANYTGVPSVEPTSSSPGPIHVDAPLSAFGGALAEGLGKLGKGAGDLGNDLYNSAQSMQNLKNATDAQNLTLAASEQMGQARADYLSKQGMDAVNALPEYQAQLKSIHAGAVDSASNPMLKVMVGRELTNRVSRDLDFAGLHAATELKRSAIQTSQATIKSLGDEAAVVPSTDPKQLTASLDKIEAETRHQGDALGWTPQITEQNVQEARSKYAAQNIKGLVDQGQAFQAEKVRKASMASGDLRGEDVGPVTKLVQGAMHTIGARNISHQVNSGQDLYPGSGQVTMGQAKDAIGTFESGNNYNNTGVQTKHGVALGKYQVMSDFLPDYLKRAGLPNMTPAQFLANHDAQETVFENTFGADMKKYGSFNEAASRWFTGRGVAAGANAPPDALGTSQQVYLRQTNAILARSGSLADKVARAKDLANQQSPDDPLLQDYAQQRVEADFNQQKRITMNDEYNNRNVVEGALMGGGQDGKMPTTVEELKNSSPEAEAAWNGLDNIKQRRYLAVMAKNAKGDNAWTEAGLRQYQALKGEAGERPAQFLDKDIPSQTLPASARRELINLQQRIMHGAEGDPRMPKYMTAVKGDLVNAGITESQSPDDYYRFRWLFESELQDFQKEKKRPANNEEAKHISDQLLQQHAVGLWSREPNEKGWGSERTFNIPAPDADAERIKALPQWQDLGITPSEKQINHIYARGLYQKFYGPKQTQEANQ